MAIATWYSETESLLMQCQMGSNIFLTTLCITCSLLAGLSSTATSSSPTPTTAPPPPIAAPEYPVEPLVHAALVSFAAAAAANGSTIPFNATLRDQLMRRVHAQLPLALAGLLSGITAPDSMLLDSVGASTDTSAILPGAPSADDLGRIDWCAVRRAHDAREAHRSGFASLPQAVRCAADGMCAIPLHRDPAIAVRQEAIRRAFVHAWTGYEKFAFGWDVLKPLTREGESHLVKMGETLVDSLDSLLLMGTPAQYARAREWVRAHLSFGGRGQTDINLFETTIRVLGGLLSAYDLSGDDLFLARAEALGAHMVDTGAFETPTGLPFGTLTLYDDDDDDADYADDGYDGASGSDASVPPAAAGVAVASFPATAAVAAAVSGTASDSVIDATISIDATITTDDTTVRTDGTTVRTDDTTVRTDDTTVRTDDDTTVRTDDDTMIRDADDTMIRDADATIHCAAASGFCSSSKSSSDGILAAAASSNFDLAHGDDSILPTAAARRKDDVEEAAAAAVCVGQCEIDRLTRGAIESACANDDGTKLKLCSVDDDESISTPSECDGLGAHVSSSTEAAAADGAIDDGLCVAPDLLSATTTSEASHGATNAGDSGVSIGVDEYTADALMQEGTGVTSAASVAAAVEVEATAEVDAEAVFTLSGASAESTATTPAAAAATVEAALTLPGPSAPVSPAVDEDSAVTLPSPGTPESPAVAENAFTLPGPGVLGPRGHAFNPHWTSGASSLSEVATLGLEFEALTARTGDQTYASLSRRIASHMGAIHPPLGLFTLYISPSSGHMMDAPVSLGARGDSAYEYMLKGWIQGGGWDAEAVETAAAAPIAVKIVRRGRELERERRRAAQLQLKMERKQRKAARLQLQQQQQQEERQAALLQKQRQLLRRSAQPPAATVLGGDLSRSSGTLDVDGGSASNVLLAYNKRKHPHTSSTNSTPTATTVAVAVADITAAGIVTAGALGISDSLLPPTSSSVVSAAALMADTPSETAPEVPSDVEVAPSGIIAEHAASPHTVAAADDYDAPPASCTAASTAVSTAATPAAAAAPPSSAAATPSSSAPAATPAAAAAPPSSAAATPSSSSAAAAAAATPAAAAAPTSSATATPSSSAAAAAAAAADASAAPSLSNTATSLSSGLAAQPLPSRTLLRMYNDAVCGMMDALLFSSSPNGLLYIAELLRTPAALPAHTCPGVSHKMDQLVCFLPGLLALGVQEGAGHESMSVERRRAMREEAARAQLQLENMKKDAMREGAARAVRDGAFPPHNNDSSSGNVSSQSAEIAEYDDITLEDVVHVLDQLLGETLPTTFTLKRTSAPVTQVEVSRAGDDTPDESILDQYSSTATAASSARESDDVGPSTVRPAPPTTSDAGSGSDYTSAVRPTFNSNGAGSGSGAPQQQPQPQEQQQRVYAPAPWSEEYATLQTAVNHAAAVVAAGRLKQQQQQQQQQNRGKTNALDETASSAAVAAGAAAAAILDLPRRPFCGPGGITDGAEAERILLRVAHELTRTCVEVFKRTTTGLAPEIVTFGQRINDFSANVDASHSLLRPETAESLFILSRVMGERAAAAAAAASTSIRSEIGAASTSTRSEVGAESTSTRSEVGEYAAAAAASVQAPIPTTSTWSDGDEDVPSTRNSASVSSASAQLEPTDGTTPLSTAQLSAATAPAAPSSFSTSTAVPAAPTSTSSLPSSTASVAAATALYRDSAAVYRDWAWELFDSIERHARVSGGGYSSVTSVNVWPLHSGPGGVYSAGRANMRNEQESFFLAETLKYLFLTFAEAEAEAEGSSDDVGGREFQQQQQQHVCGDDEDGVKADDTAMGYHHHHQQQQQRRRRGISLRDWVFNTEAHPLLIG